jgi:hypothetical protein
VEFSCVQLLGKFSPKFKLVFNDKLTCLQVIWSLLRLEDFVLRYFDADVVEAVALPAGQHHVPIQEEHHLALCADLVEHVALPAGQNHVPIQEEHHLAPCADVVEPVALPMFLSTGKFSLKFELFSNSILTYLKVEPYMLMQLKLWHYLLASTVFLSKKGGSKLLPFFSALCGKEYYYYTLKVQVRIIFLQNHARHRQVCKFLSLVKR